MSVLFKDITLTQSHFSLQNTHRVIIQFCLGFVSVKRLNVNVNVLKCSFVLMAVLLPTIHFVKPFGFH